jgi:hypothetical protein
MGNLFFVMWCKLEKHTMKGNEVGNGKRCEGWENIGGPRA